MTHHGGTEVTETRKTNLGGHTVFFAFFATSRFKFRVTAKARRTRRIQNKTEAHERARISSFSFRVLRVSAVNRLSHPAMASRASAREMGSGDLPRIMRAVAMSWAAAKTSIATKTQYRPPAIIP
jgi:hypothetical protein